MNALVVRLDSAGDVLLAGPAVRAVAATAGPVTMLCGPQGAPAARLLPGVDEVLVWEAPWTGFEPPPVRPYAVRELLGRVAARRIERALILGSYHQCPLPTALLLRMAGVRWIGADCEDHPGSLLDLRHRRKPGLHEAAAMLDLAAAGGFPLPPGDDGALRVADPPDTRRLTGEGPYVVVHPGASVPARAVSPDRAALAVRALAGAGYRTVVTGGPGETELTAEVAGRHAVDLGGRTDLAELSGVLAGASAVVVGNTGPAHLATAVGTPVICLFAPVVPAERWRPWRVPHVLLGKLDAPCAGTRARECPVPGHPCLDSITAGEIVAAVDALALGRCGRQAATGPEETSEVVA
jgi:ADP-heptose:LPS heptosyltransferase